MSKSRTCVKSKNMLLRGGKEQGQQEHQGDSGYARHPWLASTSHWSSNQSVTVLRVLRQSGIRCVRSTESRRKDNQQLLPLYNSLGKIGKIYMNRRLQFL